MNRCHHARLVVGKQYRYQSAVRTTRASPGVAVTMASVAGTASATGPSTTDTFLLCICSIPPSEAEADRSLCQAPPVRGYRRRIVADVVTEAEGVVRWLWTPPARVVRHAER